ncbi:glycosyltransferase [Janibacter anophelis]|uniref:glycosyltransferase n=1 Tax=Janibacter anophelis TaxID=319054 RepID=UPI001F0811FE|nr:glycosyltransferase [Janibacter anophelis]
MVLGGNGRGGSESQARILARGLRDAGHHVDFVIVEGGGPGDFSEVSPTYLLQSRPGRLAAPVAYARAFWRLRRRLRRGRYDAVHAIMARAYLLAPLACLGLSPKPVVLAWRRNEGAHLSGRLSMWVERLAARLCTVIACNSSSTKEYWDAHSVVASQPTRVIYNALEPVRFERCDPALPRTTPRIVSVGGLKPVKNHALLVRAIGRLPAESRPQLVLVGDGECGTDLTQLAKESAVDLILAGHQDDPRPWLAASDLYVQPSLSEGLSNALLEAMAQGLPVVATDVGGTREALGDTGEIVPSGDLRVLTESIERCLGDTSHAERLGAAARARVAERFAVGAVVQAHVDLYRGAAG